MHRPQLRVVRATDRVGLHRAAGVMITASHNPARDNGLKLCLPGARPISLPEVSGRTAGDTMPSVR